MDFQFLPFEPPAGLRPVLRQSFFAKGQIPYKSDKILPNGLVVAIFNLGEPHRLGKSPQAVENRLFADGWVHGIQTTPVFNTPSGATHVLGLLFEPPGFHALSGSNMPALVDRTIDIRSGIPAGLYRRIERILPDVSTRSAHDEIHRELLHHPCSKVPTWLDRLYGEIRSTGGVVHLNDTYQRSGLSAGHVSRTFRARVGVSPKVLCRIYRLNTLLAAIDPAEDVNWTLLAHDAGFFDQAHFNHEFQRFSGLTPGAFLDARRRSLPRLGKGEAIGFAPQD